MECARCGADLDPSATGCRYCGAPTPFADRLRAEALVREERASRERASVQEQTRASGRQQLDQAATRALIFALVGMVFCLAPILQIVAIVFYMRARAIARQASVDVPPRATVAFFISAMGLVLGPAFLVWALVRDDRMQERADARIAALDAEVTLGVQQTTLDRSTACRLAELYVLKSGYGDQRGKNLIHFDCVGQMTGSPQRPALERFTFRSDINDATYDVSVCFDRGAKWYVKEMTSGHACPDVAGPAPQAPGRPIAR